MASDSSMDIVSQFDLQEVRNAFDQTKKEIAVRYDLKDMHIELELTDENLYLRIHSVMIKEKKRLLVNW